MAGTTSYKNKWQQEHKDRIILITPKGYKDIVKKAAGEKEKSVNAYILNALKKQLKEDNILI